MAFLNVFKVVLLTIHLVGLVALTKGDGLSDFGLTDAERDQLLKEHNDARKARGASNMFQLTWDNNLAKDAMTWAKGCQFKHGQPSSPAYTAGSVGQNLAYTTQYSATKMNGFHAWMSEKDYYSFSSNECWWPPCGHYTQAMWASHEKVGCAYHVCAVMDGNGDKNAKYLVCNYSPAGNVNGVMPWKVGDPCKDCPYCHNNLCATKASCDSGTISCQCNRKCQHCGVLSSDCKCQCPTGTRGENCEYLCRNKKEECRYFSKSTCTDGTSTGKVVNDFCDVTCEHCTQNKDTAWTCGAENYQNTFVKYASNPQYGYKTDGGASCVFPFRYNGTYHHSCLPGKDGQSDWCSKSTNYEKYRTYSSGCAKVKTTEGNAGGANCVFPTEYANKFHQKCIEEESTGKKWCGTTANYPADKKWGYCDLTGVSE